MDNYCSTLQSLPPGSEVNIHTADKSYYNAIFKKYYHRTNTALFLVDQFYSYGGIPVLIHCSKITSMDSPFTMQDVSDEDE